MKKVVCGFIVALVSLGVCGLALAQEDVQQTPEQQQKDLLITNIVALRNQEARVIVLQQLLNEEISELRRTQAVFCDQYNLNLDTFRAGLYRYDETTGKFVEDKVEMDPSLEGLSQLEDDTAQ